MKNSKIATALAAMTAVSIFFTACGSQTAQTLKQQDLKKSVVQITSAKDASKNPEQAKNRKDTLIVGGKLPKGKISPIAADGLYDQYAVTLVFNSLVNNDEYGNPIPEIAKDWKISSDGLTYTFNLRDDVKFSDGSRLTADDVAFTYTAIADPKYDGPLSSYAAWISGYKDYNSGSATSLSGIKVDSPTKIEIKLDEKNSSALLNFFGSILILSKKYYNFDKGNYDKIAELNTKPMGSGPYKLTAFKKGQEVDFEKNSSYFKGSPKINKIIMVSTDSTTNLQKITKGETDIDKINAIPQNVSQLQQAGFLDQQIYSDLGYYYIGLNLKDPVFTDKKVRQALAYGLDRKDFVDSFYKGYGDVSNEPFSPVQWAYSNDINQYKYDKDKAAKLLDEAGWKLNNSDGFRYKDGKKFTFKFLYDPTGAYGNALAPVIKDNYKKIGIDVELVSLDFDTILDKIDLKNGKRDYQAYTMGWSLSCDPDATQIFDSSQDVAGGSNNVSFHNDESDKLLKEGLKEFDQNKRKEIYNKWAKLMNDQLPYIFLSSSKDLWAVNSRVKGFKMSPFYYWTHDIEKVSLK